MGRMIIDGQIAGPRVHAESEDALRIVRSYVVDHPDCQTRIREATEKEIGLMTLYLLKQK